MLTSYYVFGQKNCNKGNFVWGRQQQNFWIKITDSRLSYDELGLHDEEIFNGNYKVLWKIDIVKAWLISHY